MKWIKNFPFKDGNVILLMYNDKKRTSYKVVDDIITSRIYDEIPKYLENWIKTGRDVCQQLPDGTYRIFGMTRTNFSNVLAFIYKDDLIEEYKNSINLDKEIIL